MGKIVSRAKVPRFRLRLPFKIENRSIGILKSPFFLVLIASMATLGVSYGYTVLNPSSSLVVPHPLPSGDNTSRNSTAVRPAINATAPHPCEPWPLCQ